MPGDSQEALIPAQGVSVRDRNIKILVCVSNEISPRTLDAVLAAWERN